MVCVSYDKNLQPTYHQTKTKLKSKNFHTRHLPSYCCFPGCKSFGHPRQTSKASLKLGDRYFLFPIHGNTFGKAWLRTCGLDFDKLPVDPDDPTKKVDAYLCDGHFSLKNYKHNQGERYNTIKLKLTARPDILNPNPVPLYYRALKNIKNGMPIDTGIDMKFSLMTSVPANYNVKVGQHCLPCETYNSDLRILVPWKICCFCAKPCENDAVNLLNKDMTECSEFGRVISVMTSLSETKLLSPYACLFCANKTLTCFHRLVEINAKLIIASDRVDSMLNIIDTPDQLPCPSESCNDVLDNMAEYKDHMLEHIVAHPEVDATQEKIDFKEPDEARKNMEEGELQMLKMVKEEVLPSKSDADHGYTSQTFKIEPEAEVAALCDICGVEIVGERALIGHLAKHRYNKSEMEKEKKLCPQCGKYFNAAYLDDHIKRHDVNFVDPISKKTRKTSYLTETCRFYSCTVPGCDTKYSTWQERDDHLLNFHGKKAGAKAKCYHCGFRSLTRMMKRHLEKVHPDKVVARCEDCNVNFFHENALIIHNAQKHPALHKTYLQQKDLLLKSTISSSRRKHAESMNKRKSQVVEEYNTYIVRPATVKTEKPDSSSVRPSKKSKQDEETARYIAQAVGRKRPAETPQSTVSKAISALATPAGKRSGSSPKKVQQRSRYSNYSNSPKQLHIDQDDDDVYDNRNKLVKREYGHSESRGGKWSLPRLDATPVQDTQYANYSGYRPTSDVKYVWESAKEEDNNVEYMEQVSATEYLVIDGDVIKKHLSYM